MRSNAQRNLYDDALEAQPGCGAPGAEDSAALRRLAAERLAAHRTRRALLEPHEAKTAVERAGPAISESAQRVRAAVEARFRTSPSYNDLLDARSVKKRAVFVAEPVPEAIAAPVAEQAFVEPVFAATAEASVEVAASGFEAVDASALQVRPFEELWQPMTPPAREFQNHAAGHAEELESLEEEIEFRLAPEFDEHLIEPLTIQANIIEFPRQLVAPRKARPRLAEGPLRSNDEVEHAEQAAAASEEFQMRIFEVEPESAIGSAAAVEPTAPEWQEAQWQDMVLDAVTPEPAPTALPEPHTAVAASVQLSEQRPNLPVASLELRVMSAVVDAIYIGFAYLAFATVAAWVGGRALEGLALKTLLAASGVAIALLALLYQTVFFTLGGATPGMAYANLVFRTLSGQEPTRQAMRKRVRANVLAVVPLGLGLLWSVFDRQRLGWNDRMSGVFLREF